MISSLLFVRNARSLFAPQFKFFTQVSSPFVLSVLWASRVHSCTLIVLSALQYSCCPECTPVLLLSRVHSCTLVLSALLYSCPECTPVLLLSRVHSCTLVLSALQYSCCPECTLYSCCPECTLYSCCPEYLCECTTLYRSVQFTACQHCS